MKAYIHNYAQTDASRQRERLSQRQGDIQTHTCIYRLYTQINIGRYGQKDKQNDITNRKSERQRNR